MTTRSTHLPAGPAGARPQLRRRRHRGSAPRAVATRLGLGLVLAATVAAMGACGSNNAAAPSATDAQPSFSITMPPNAVVNGTVGDANTGSTGTATGLGAGSATAIAPENQQFCEIMQQAGASLTGPNPGASNDAAAMTEFKTTFQSLADAAPSTIKPEVAGMNNVIQTVQSNDDIQKLDDPDFTNEQAAVAQWVQQNCGFEVG